MKAESVELVPRDTSSVTLGADCATSVMSIAPDFASCAPVMAVTAIGTSLSVSARRRAVTTIAPVSASAGDVAAAVEAVDGGASGAAANKADGMTTVAAVASNRRCVNETKTMISSPLVASRLDRLHRLVGCISES
jgi:hypothetical protein